MFGRTLMFAGGIAGAVALSQFPEFSQQYLQRLAGQVDALTAVVADFDSTAARSGLNRDEALDQLQGTPFLEGRQADMTRSFARHARMTQDLALLRAMGPLERLALPHRMSDVATLQATWADFRPAVPVTVEGLACAGIGFAGGMAVLWALLSLLAWPFRRVRAV